MIPVSSFLAALEFTKRVFGRGCAPLGKLTALSQTSSWFKGPYILAVGGKGRE